MLGPKQVRLKPNILSEVKFTLPLWREIGVILKMPNWNQNSGSLKTELMLLIVQLGTCITMGILKLV